MNDPVSEQAAINLEAIVEQERTKRLEAEKTTQALIEEFTNCNDFDDIRKTFRESVKDIAPQALANIIQLMNTAESESVRSNLNKWVLEWVMSDKIDGTKDDIANLLKELKGNDAKATNAEAVDD